MYCLELMQPNDMFAGEHSHLAIAYHHSSMRMQLYNVLGGCMGWTPCKSMWLQDEQLQPC